MYLNEQVIRNFYWEIISNYVNKYFKTRNSVIDENFFYLLIRQESEFNPNSISPTLTRWLLQITMFTTNEIIKYNKKLLKNKEFIKKYPWIEEMLITDVNAITWKIKFKKYEKWYMWVYTQFYDPLISIKLSLSYLMRLEKAIDILKLDIDNKFKKQLLLVSYNSWPVIIEIAKKKNIKSWEQLKKVLIDRLPRYKYKEVVFYVENILK